MDWQSTSAEIIGYYVPGGWYDFTSASIPPSKSAHPSDSLLVSAAKRLCTGLSVAYYATRNAIASATYDFVPTYLIVRQVRQRQREQLRRPRRKRSHSRSSSPLAKSSPPSTYSAIDTNSFQHADALHLLQYPQPTASASSSSSAAAYRYYFRRPSASQEPTYSSPVELENITPQTESTRPASQALVYTTTPARSPSSVAYDYYPHLRPETPKETERNNTHRNKNKFVKEQAIDLLETNRLTKDPPAQNESKAKFSATEQSILIANDVFGSDEPTIDNMPVSMNSPFDRGDNFTSVKRPRASGYRVKKHVRRPSTANSSSSDEPITPQKQIFDMRKFLKKDEPIIKQETKFTPVRPSRLQTPWHDQPNHMETESDSQSSWDPIQDKEYRRICRAKPEKRRTKTGEHLPIDGVLSPESFQYNIDSRANKQLMHTLKTPGLSADLSRLSIEDRTPKASRYREQRDGRITRANIRRLELEKEKDQYKIAQLTKEWEEKVKTAVRSGHGNYQPTDFARVVPQYAGRKGQDNWLNDEVINGYLKMISDHGKKQDRKDQVPSHHAFNSFFYSNLKTKGPDSIKNWAKRAKIGGKNLLDTDKVFIPIHQGMHWTLAVVEAKQRRITVYNSMGTSRGDEVAHTILTWVQAEVGVSFNPDEWTLNGKGVSPQQENSDDCGVFTITNARQIMLGKEPAETYRAKDIPVQRMRIVAELVNGALLK